MWNSKKACLNPVPTSAPFTDGLWTAIRSLSSPQVVFSQNVLFQEQKGNQNKTRVTPPRNLRLENEEFISQHPLAHRWSCDMAQHLLACSFPVACSFFLSLSDLLNLNRKFLGFRQLCLFIWSREWVNSTDLFLPIMHSSSLIQYSRYYDQGTVSECGRSSHCSRYYVSGYCVPPRVPSCWQL